MRILSADELVEIARRDNPAVQYTRNKQGNAIAARRQTTEPWQTVAMKAEYGHWCRIGDLSIDGETVNPPEDWLDSPHAHELINRTGLVGD